MVIRQSLQDYTSIGTGTPERREGAAAPSHPGLTEQETVVLQALVELGEASAAAVASALVCASSA